MYKIDPTEYPHQKLHKILLGGVAPRPIAFASTIDKNGQVNLSPFSFYNAFGVNPSTLIFSPSRRGRDNTTKHTLENILEVPEVVINAVNFEMVQQMSLSSTEYPKGVDEFVKSGLTPIASVVVKPPRVKESPLQFECRVREVIETGGRAGSANLVVCEIVMIHIDKGLLDDEGNIDTDKIDLVGRLGGDYYVRTVGNAKFKVPKPLSDIGMGVDRLPEHIRFSKYLSGNDLGILGNLKNLPSVDEIKSVSDQFSANDLNEQTEKNLHNKAKKLIAEGKPYEALKILMVKTSR
ncbi:MAG: flavin reductase family protein [Bacteroidales bacterium]|jgi:flavin reductase (DIM6/NTAB) family NADH-FMN oxidoreductase RutF|nr:flavin reductase family protein [Bacteroidales bacterium]